MATLSFYVLWSVRDAPRQFIRCLIWEGDWRRDVATAAAEKGRRGVYGKIVLTVCAEETDAVFGSIQQVEQKCLFPDLHNSTDLSCTLNQSSMDETVPADSSQLGDSVCCGEIQVNRINTSDSTFSTKPPVWPTEKTPRRTVISRGRLTWSSEDPDGLSEDLDQASTRKKRRLSRKNSQEEMTAQIRSDNREACPSKRWSHTMCLSDPDTAVLIGGETAAQTHCKDSLWKLELDNDFWFPMTSSASGPRPPCARGHSATFDPDSRSVFVYGGLREDQRYSQLYVLDTLSWTWKTVTAKGNIPQLAYHSANFYNKELFVFGGVNPSSRPGEKSCSGSLYIYNPEFQLWYQPIVEGDKPLPRFGHSATLMSDKLIIFGGRTTATYLNDLHVLDLDTNTWSSVPCPPLCSRPRAGHSVVHLSSSAPKPSETSEQREGVSACCTLLVFGGSDCCGTFYNDTLKCTLEIPDDQ
ncbi:unnamed protein product [Tetraodon nigroviridis]|uniref:Chromosome 10 SCAF15019, whole genome shotgun sequence n=1 Tax=Tetraodon nigroviridis TaxID=99883 RepID=Q4RLX8_TETNG|nr:unnamed protein product [Tetraodon nigroviridis]